MKFVKSNSIDIQKLMSVTEPIHYIFALDQSGSMSGGKWEDLMGAFKAAISSLRKITDSESCLRVSILVFK